MLLTLFKKISTYNNTVAIIQDDLNFTYNDLKDEILRYKDYYSKHELKNKVILFDFNFSFNKISELISLLMLNNIVALYDFKINKNVINYEDYNIEFLINNEGLVKVESNQKIDRNIKKLKNSETCGLIIFSSGSTGKPKAILHDLNKLFKKFNEKKKVLRTFSLLSPEHIGGINTLFHSIYNGGEFVLLKDKSPSNVGKAISKYKIECLNVTPTFLNMLVFSDNFKELDLSSLKILNYSGEVINEATLLILKEKLKDAKICQSYGLTELGILTSHTQKEDPTWIKFDDNFDFKIINNILFVKIESSMLGYLNLDNPFDEGGYFNTGDIIEEKGGYYRIIGRESNLINIGGSKIYPKEIENVILKIPEVIDCIIIPKKNLVTGNHIECCIYIKDLERKELIKKNVKKACFNELPNYAFPQKIFFVNEPLINHRLKKAVIKENI